MSRAKRFWYSAEAIALPEAREAIEYGLIEAGAVGSETNEAGDRLRITGYYDGPVSEPTIRAALLEALRIYSISPASLIDLRRHEVAEIDWLSEWKKGWQPVEVGARFIIAPPWSEIENAGGRTVVRIEPGMAFGTGTHETTRLCLKAIEKHFRGGSFLDIGTGTGILAISAAKLFSDARVEACDTDAEAVEIARENARLNGVAERIDFRVGTVDEQTESADFVCANLTAPVIVDLLPLLVGAACGRLVLSGILVEQIELVQSRLFELGATILHTERDGEWIMLVI